MSKFCYYLMQCPISMGLASFDAELCEESIAITRNAIQRSGAELFHVLYKKVFSVPFIKEKFLRANSTTVGCVITRGIDCHQSQLDRTFRSGVIK